MVCRHWEDDFKYLVFELFYGPPTVVFAGTALRAFVHRSRHALLTLDYRGVDGIVVHQRAVHNISLGCTCECVRMWSDTSCFDVLCASHSSLKVCEECLWRTSHVKTHSLVHDNPLGHNHTESVGR